MPTPGPLELVIILVIALIILGPGKLPDVGASLGKSIREFRKASSDIQEAATVKVDTSPLPPAAEASADASVAPAQAPPVATAAPYLQATPTDVPVPGVVDPNDRIAELERQLAEARSNGTGESTPVGAGRTTGGAGSSAAS